MDISVDVQRLVSKLGLKVGELTTANLILEQQIEFLRAQNADLQNKINNLTSKEQGVNK